MDEGFSEPRSRSHRPRPQSQTKGFSFRKRTVPKFPCRYNDVYINNKSNLQSQLAKCEKLLEEGFDEIFIHGLGAAICTAINVALMLQEKLSHTVDIAANTSSVDLTDDFFPLSDDEKHYSATRTNSAIHIRLKKKPNI